jgi:uncharacterized protein YwgA
MSVDDLVLTVIGQCTGAVVRGRTRLQKILYFLCDRLRVDARFAPHYYGPYSELVSRSVDSLVARGLVKEEVRHVPSEGPFEGRLYEYSLKSEGHEVLDQLRKAHPDEYKTAAGIVDEVMAGEPSTQALAVASKLHVVVSQSEREVPITSLSSRASKFGWAIRPQAVQDGVEFLVEKGFAKKVPAR